MTRENNKRLTIEQTKLCKKKNKETSKFKMKIIERRLRRKEKRPLTKC